MTLPFTEIPLTALAIPILTNRERARIQAIDDAPTLHDVESFLTEQINISSLQSIFNTPRRRARLRQAYDLFTDCLQEWHVGERRRPHFTWLISEAHFKLLSNGLVTPTEIFDTVALLARRRSEMIFDFVRSLSRIPGARNWLPFISIQGVRRVSKFSKRDLALLQGAIGRRMIQLGTDPLLRPWHDEFPESYRSLPVYWLYTHSEMRRARLATLLERLTRVGYRNLGHLPVTSPHLHPHLKGKANRESWRRLFRLVDNLNPAPRSTN